MKPSTLTKVACPLAAVLALTPAAYCWMFSRFVSYDDEGYFLLSLDLVRSGGPLYDVIDGYGPLYYLIFGPVFDLIGSVTHNGGRMVTLVLWLGASALIGVAILRITGVIWSVGATAVALTLLSGLALEPMNPGGLLAVCISGAVLLATHADECPRRSVTGIAVIAVAAALVKINVGAFLLAPLVYAFVSTRRIGPTWVRFLVSACLAALPIVIMHTDLDGRWGRFALVLVVAFLAVVVAARRLPAAPADDAASRTAVLSLAAGLLLAAVTLFATIAHGTTLAGLWRGIVQLPLTQPGAFNFEPAGEPLGLGLLAAPVALAAPRLPRLVLAVVGAIGSTVALFLALQTQSLPSVSIFAWGVPLVWLLLQGREGPEFSRCFIAAFAMTAPLQAYPVPGTQMCLGLLPLVTALVVILADSVEEIFSEIDIRGHDLLPIGLCLFALAYAAIDFGGAARRGYDGGGSLSFAGADRLHLPPATTLMLEKAVAELRGCSQFVTLPGQPSLYLYAGTRPRFLLPQAWQITLGAAEQRRIADTLRADERACVVHAPAVEQFWNRRRTPEDRPLYHFLSTSFKESARAGHMRILVRR